jgi:hypothetical protein
MAATWRRARSSAGRFLPAGSAAGSRSASSKPRLTSIAHCSGGQCRRVGSGLSGGAGRSSPDAPVRSFEQLCDLLRNLLPCLVLRDPALARQGAKRAHPAERLVQIEADVSGYIVRTVDLPSGLSPERNRNISI